MNYHSGQERIVFDMFAAQLLEAKDHGISQIELLMDERSEVRVRPVFESVISSGLTVVRER